MEEHRGLVGERWRGYSRYEDVPLETRQALEQDLETLRLMYPPSLHDTTTFIIGAWGMGNAWSLGDLDVVFSPEDDALAPSYREQWLATADEAIRQLHADMTIRHEIRVEHSFGLKPLVGYDVALQQVIGRPEGVSLRKKCVFNKDLGIYEMTDIPFLPHPRGSYLDDKQRRHWL